MRSGCRRCATGRRAKRRRPCICRVDPDVLRWFKGQGKGHLTRMNAVLRAYYEANRKKAS